MRPLPKIKAEIRLVSNGETYYEKGLLSLGDGGFDVEYFESGAELPTKVRLSYDGEEFHIFRKSKELYSHLNINPHADTDCRYKTAYGEIVMMLRTERLSVVKLDNKAVVEAVYSLYQGGESVVDNKMEVSITWLRD